MIAVIICGGSGTRLWPLSTPDKPKQVLKISGDESLLQNAYKRARKLTNQVYVVPEASMVEHVRQQLPDLPKEAFIIEPARRGTASCIVVALHYVQSRHGHDEPIAFIHADHYIRDAEGFVRSFQLAAELTVEHKQMVLIGVEPTYPATGFGYIQKDGPITSEAVAYSVLGFTEKPDFTIARQYVNSGQYLWNCGYFIGTINVFLDTMKTHAPQLYGYYQQLMQTQDPEAYKEAYLSFEKDTIDYALLEKVDNLIVVPASFDWMDLGSFNDVHRAVDTDEAGNHTGGEGIELEMVENSFIRNEEPSKPVAVIGLDNIVVVNTPHGLLVARKDLSQRVGDISKRIQAKKSD